MSITDININVKDIIIPMYDDVLQDMLEHWHTHYTLAGGRGTTKSSFAGVGVIMLIVTNPLCHALCVRKVGNTIKDSIWSQIVWAINTLGLEEHFHIPKTHANPIVFKPTGQMILFKGLDDSNKIKSIKLPFGYIGITWFEELDQFAGENELRKVTQSTMRGGQKFWDIRTFNPPISNMNWANEYADEAENREDTLVVRNTYLDVPPEWLGEQFFIEAEQLKLINPRAYEHEYLGKAVGTGGNVFDNVVDMDMTQLVGGEIPLYKTFHNIFNGLDWGFAADPTQFVRMHYDVKRHDLYIFDEHRTYGSRNIQIFEELYEGDNPHISTTELLSFDIAEEKSGADFKAYGAFVRGARKGPDSVHYGIKWLQGLSHIYIDKRRCPHTYKEFVRYEYERDKDDNIISAYPDKNNHSIDAVRYAMWQYCRRKGN